MLSDRLSYTYILVGNTTSVSGSVECAYIGHEGDVLLLTKTCEQPLLGRFVTLLRDESSSAALHINTMTLCEVVVDGFRYPPGENFVSRSSIMTVYQEIKLMFYIVNYFV